ncbi:MAG: hypothetical protein SGBAC_012206 [Bacillariaceae sp.]
MTDPQPHPMSPTKSKSKSKPSTRLSSTDFSPITLGGLNSPRLSKIKGNKSNEISSSSNNTIEFEVRDDDEGKSLTLGGLADDNWKITGNMDGFGGRAILREGNDNGDIVEVILSQKRGVHFNYKLLSATPMFPGQKKYRSKVKGQKMYEHANVKQQNYFVEDYDIEECSSQEDKEEGHVDYIVRGRDIGALEMEVYSTDSHKRCGIIHQDDDSTWKASADNEKINPKLMACLTAIASKSLG